MDLLLDVGNTRLKWGLHDGAGWQGQGAVLLTALDGFADVLATLGPIQRMLGANVAGASVGGRLGAMLAVRQVAPVWIQPRAEGFGVVNRYTEPARLGADRWGGSGRRPFAPCWCRLGGDIGDGHHCGRARRLRHLPGGA